MEKIKTYLKGLLFVMALIIVGLVGFLFLGLVSVIVFVAMLIIFVFIAIFALVLLPYYYAKDHKVKSKNFKLKKVKDKENI